MHPSSQTVRGEENKPPTCPNFWALEPRKLDSFLTQKNYYGVYYIINSYSDKKCFTVRNLFMEGVFHSDYDGQWRQLYLQKKFLGHIVPDTNLGADSATSLLEDRSYSNSNY